ncbi:nucleotidyltransferase domain-containing protein [Sinorhizobium fredii]|uniref:Nucleotidyltransferase domain-containing protein n=1 Tax=Rhizobium fredii TaxID=380 RepID=A0A2A6LUT5_RHIFR|nr:nucleotidyltransferase domain-containing protein [Sinorhizobium fredii]PDT46006.1 nucleotidyltransferase domain-containing protein [Sinorhizobium fredii]
MINGLPPSILNVSLFGSTSRSDNDSNSDLDVLVVVANGTGKTPPDAVSETIKHQFGKPPSLSWYGLRKIKALFAGGDLFAWHLHLESQLIGGHNLSQIAGIPADYTSALSDINDLRKVALSVEKTISSCPENAVFEMGILYVCARNIAMSASWRLSPRPSFGRYSPFDLPLSFSIDRKTYEMMIQSRMASQRGTAPPEVSADQVLETQQRLLVWSQRVMTAVERVEGRT